MKINFLAYGNLPVRRDAMHRVSTLNALQKYSGKGMIRNRRVF
jgi:hypothetical protein